MSEKKFLFITKLTPASKRSETRAGLLRLMEQSLHAQSYPHWKALWLGEEESTRGKIQSVDVSKEGSLREIYLRNDLKQLIDWADYIVKLDDDDIILSHTLELAATLDFDCYCDRYHSFYDLSTGITTQQARPWIAATCIHKKEHAVTLNRYGGASWNQRMQKPDWHPEAGKAENFIHSLFYGEHGNDWIEYYQSKKIVYARPQTPIYVRILSPTSISAGAKKFPVHSLLDVDLDAYRSYIHRFGSWNSYPIDNWSAYPPLLRSIWQQFSNGALHPQPKISALLKLKEKIQYWQFRVFGK
jgi:hypothetical protein